MRSPSSSYLFPSQVSEDDLRKLKLFYTPASCIFLITSSSYIFNPNLTLGWTGCVDAGGGNGFDTPLADGCFSDSFHAMLKVALTPAGIRHGGAVEGGDGARGVTCQPGLGLSLADLGIEMGSIFVN